MRLKKYNASQECGEMMKGFEISMAYPISMCREYGLGWGERDSAAFRPTRELSLRELRRIVL
jgi:hypothetical protein